MNEPSRLDENTYDSSRIYLKTALEHMLEAGRSVRELSEFTLEKFGADFLPYLRQFLHDVGHGRISVRGLSRSAQAALSGHTVSSEERECMIREAAYLRAERRGFCGGSPEQDWLEAEHEVDMRLAQGEGVVVKGGRALAAVATTVEQELAGSKQVVTRWLERKFPNRAAAERKQPAASKAVSGGRTADSTPRAPVEAKKKTAVKKSPASAKVAKKTAVRKKSSKEQAAKKAAPGKHAASGRGASPAAGGTPASRKKAVAKKPSAAPARKKVATKKRAGAKAARKPGRRGTR